MALFKTRSAAVYGIDAHLIDVEVDMYSSGSARDSRMVGMPDVAVRESRERIKSALINSGFGYPNQGCPRREGRDPVGLRGELSALRLVLTIPGILKGEIKSSLKE